MILTKQILNFKSNILNGLCFLIQNIAILIFNYPKNPGMLIFPDNLNKRATLDFNLSLPIFTTRIPPVPEPKTFLQAIFGNIPKIIPVLPQFFPAQ